MMSFLDAKLQSEESKEILGAMFEACAEYLQTAIDEITQKFESIEIYAEKGLGFTKE